VKNPKETTKATKVSNLESVPSDVPSSRIEGLIQKFKSNENTPLEVPSVDIEGLIQKLKALEGSRSKEVYLSSVQSSKGDTKRLENQNELVTGEKREDLFTINIESVDQKEVASVLSELTSSTTSSKRFGVRHGTNEFDQFDDSLSSLEVFVSSLCSRPFFSRSCPKEASREAKINFR